MIDDENNNNNNNNEVIKMVIVGENYCKKEEMELTVHKKSMFSKGDGFLVYDTNGDIIFRVDFYGLINKFHAHVLMDSFGKPLLTLLPKRATLHHRLEGFLGDTSDGQQPIMSIWKSSIIGRSGMIEVEVYDNETHKPTQYYNIDGNYKERSCTIFKVQSDTSKQHVAEIKRKVEPTRQIMLGKDVFSLSVKAGVDAAFAMGLVLALDHIDGHDVEPTSSTCT